MNKEELVELLKTNVEKWNELRKENKIKIPIDLRKVNLQEVHLYKANLKDVNLNGSILCNANLQKSDLRRTSLKYADLQNADLSRARLLSANLKGANLCRAILFDASCYQVNFEETNLQKAKLQNADLKDSILDNADLYSANLKGGNLKGAKIKHASLQNLNLQSVDLSGADLKYSNFRNAHLKNAHLRNTSLEGADLQRANLENVNLEDANLLDANFKNTNLSGIEINDYTIINLWNIEGVKCTHIFYNGKRKPEDRDFEEGEFENIYKSIPTLEVFFEKDHFSPIDLPRIAVLEAVLAKQYPELELKLRSINNTASRPSASLQLKQGLNEDEIKQLVLHTFNQIKDNSVIEFLQEQVKEKDNRITQLTDKLIAEMSNNKNNPTFNINANSIGSLNNNTGDGTFNQTNSNIDLEQLKTILESLKPQLDQLTVGDQNMITDIIKEESDIPKKESKIKEVVEKYGFAAIQNLATGATLELFKLWLA